MIPKVIFVISEGYLIARAQSPSGGGTDAHKTSNFIAFNSR